MITRLPALPDAAADLPDAAARFSVALGRLVRMLRRSGPEGMGAGSVSALATLTRSGSMRLGDLAVREGISPPTLTRIVAGLHTAGYVERRPDPEDGRAALVAATPAGADVVRGIGSAKLAVLQERMSQLAPDQLAALLEAIPVIEALAGQDG